MARAFLMSRNSSRYAHTDMAGEEINMDIPSWNTAHCISHASAAERAATFCLFHVVLLGGLHLTVSTVGSVFFLSGVVFHYHSGVLFRLQSAHTFLTFRFCALPSKLEDTR
ncbi:hypothetical protein IscW_ISCW010445 [Ixodes scapularis]|uniref:Uncharacterized protein n=1 Tax=Ixodes scapularis TaxID=6945 RepID=B7Q770_IXOSC|nr:hypothetical protein IscW_ISCW010445 [Ixodes scapularis]|eukprot:XP_002403720.1 hypothetical protein IscW_ISCW010445 [Ixodes scapularis]